MSRNHGGRADQVARAALAPLVYSGMAVCWRGGQPIAPTDEWDAGHLHDVALGGNRRGPRRPEHVRCNRSAGGQLGNQLRRPSRRRVTSWLAFFPRKRSGEPSDAEATRPSARACKACVKAVKASTSR